MTSANAIAVPVVDAPAALSELLRSATADQHQRAETRPFIAELMGGELTLADYVSYVAQFAHVYEALESRDVSTDPAPLDDAARLARLASIESDLAALGAADWRETHPALPATAAYVARLRELAQGRYAEYLAHHYTRYLGDLSGGQAIGAMIARHYGATPDQLAFFRFDDIEKPVIYKREYREALDALELTAEEREAILAEARAAFDYNAAVFDELGSRADAA
ncbi:MAG TPA: biliverdin-producing heme oxygenase [Microbacteriaceae bacterium]|nr:biliverdin-producing heme oxygenase [Microbacteriaceae bacterium]